MNFVYPHTQSFCKAELTQDPFPMNLHATRIQACVLQKWWIATAGLLLFSAARAAPATEPPEALVSRSLEVDASLTRVAFGSCYAPQLEQPQIWNAIAQAKPQLVLLTGDNVYQSEERAEPGLRELREAYALLAAEPEFGALRRQATVLATWDDHDYGLNDAGAEFSQRAESEAVFEAVWPLPAGATRAQGEGIHSAMQVGPAGRRVQILLLDSRSFRDPWPPPEHAESASTTLLGAEQWSWLQQGLKEPADLRIVVSSIPVLSERKQGENWARMPVERQRLLQLLEQRAGGGLLIVSGDTHFGARFEVQSQSGERLVEVLSSSLNLPITPEGRPGLNLADATRRDEVVFDANFGLLEIDWESSTVSITLRGDDGRILLETSHPFLTPRPAIGEQDAE